MSSNNNNICLLKAVTTQLSAKQTGKLIISEQKCLSSSESEFQMMGPVIENDNGVNLSMTTTTFVPRYWYWRSIHNLYLCLGTENIQLLMEI